MNLYQWRSAQHFAALESLMASISAFLIAEISFAVVVMAPVVATYTGVIGSSALSVEVMVDSEKVEPGDVSVLPPQFIGDC